MRHFVGRFAAVLMVQAASHTIHGSRVTIVAVQRIVHRRG